MTGFASTMRSPSSFRTTLRTPCVDGCWGPRLISISVVWNKLCLHTGRGRTVAREGHGAPGPRRGLLSSVKLVIPWLALEGIVLAKRIPLPIVRQEDPGQVGMTLEADP